MLLVITATLKTQLIESFQYKFSEKEFNVEMFRMFTELKETMKGTINKTMDMRAQIRKIQMEMSQLKS